MLIETGAQVVTVLLVEDDLPREQHPHADAYVTKPIDFDAFAGTVREIDDFFVAVVRASG